VAAFWRKIHEKALNQNGYQNVYTVHSIYLLFDISISNSKYERIGLHGTERLISILILLTWNRIYLDSRVF